MAKLTINIGAKIDGMKRGLANAQSSVKSWSRKISGMTKLALGTAFVGFGAGLFSIIKKSAQLAAQFEQIKVAFTTMTGSAARAKGLIEELNEFSKATPFSPEQVFKAGKTLLAFGFEAKEVSNTLRLLGDVSAGTGKDLGEMAVIFGQIKGAGRLMGQDLLQLINAGFNPLQVMSKKTGKSMAELKDEMSKGAISFQMVEDAFRDATAEGGIFFNMMEKQSQTLNGQLSTLEGSVNDLARGFGETFLPEIKSVVGWMQKLAGTFEEVAAARKLLDAKEISTGLDPFQEFAKAALNNMSFGIVGDMLAPEDFIESPAASRAAQKAMKEKIEEARLEKELAKEDKATAIEMGDGDFASADPMGDVFAEMRTKWDKAWADRDVRIAEQGAKDEKEAKAKALQEMKDAFRPGGEVQSRLARIGGDRTITTDSVQKEMLAVQKQMLAVNERVAMAVEDYDGPTFPSN